MRGFFSSSSGPWNGRPTIRTRRRRRTADEHGSIPSFQATGTVVDRVSETHARRSPRGRSDAPSDRGLSLPEGRGWEVVGRARRRRKRTGEGLKRTRPRLPAAEPDRRIPPRKTKTVSHKGDMATAPWYHDGTRDPATACRAGRGTPRRGRKLSENGASERTIGRPARRQGRPDLGRKPHSRRGRRPFWGSATAVFFK